VTASGWQQLLALARQYRVGLQATQPRLHRERDGRHFSERYRRFAVKLAALLLEQGVRPAACDTTLYVRCACGICPGDWRRFDVEVVSGFAERYRRHA
jgi:hypothetical protein